MSGSNCADGCWGSKSGCEIPDKLAILTPVKEEKKEDIKFDSNNKEKKYYRDKQQFLKYCLDIKFITKDKLDELDSLYDTLKGKIEPFESADNATAFKNKSKLRKLCLAFFYHWYNSPGRNTQEGFDKWIESDEAKDILKVDEPKEGNGGWISVKTEPKIGIKYLFLTDEIMFPDNAFTGVYYGNGEWIKSETTKVIKNVTHYQELPDTSKLTNY